MVIFLKRKRKSASSSNQHITINEKGRVYVDGVYAGFEDDSFKVVYTLPSVDEQTFVSRQVRVAKI